MILSELLDDVIEIYEDVELFTFDFMENSQNGWEFLASSAFKKGLKKHRNDKRVMKAFKELTDFVIQHNERPNIRDYPQEFNVHAIKHDPKFAGTLWSHLKGQVIGLLFSVENDKTIKLIHLGTHQEIGWS